MNIDKIEVNENNIALTIFPKKNQVLIDEKYYPIKDEEILEFIRIIRTWNNEYSDNSYYDGNRFSVRVYYEDRIDEINGVRGVPSNYMAFIKFIRSIYDRR